MLPAIRASELLRAVGQGQLLRSPRRELRPDRRAFVRMPMMTRSTESAPSQLDWSAFYSALNGFVAARVRNASDVDDLVQLILERAMAKSTSVEIQNAAGWLFGIARNAVADHYRAQARALITDADALEASAPFGSSDEERREVLGCMEPLLATLPAETARLLRWSDMEDRAMQAIADELGITLTAAKSRVQRARKEFVKATRDCCAITVDSRGRVTNLTPKLKSAAVACQPIDPSKACCPSDPRKTS